MPLRARARNVCHGMGNTLTGYIIQFDLLIVRLGWSEAQKNQCSLVRNAPSRLAKMPKFVARHYWIGKMWHARAHNSAKQPRLNMDHTARMRKLCGISHCYIRWKSIGILLIMYNFYPAKFCENTLIGCTPSASER